MRKIKLILIILGLIILNNREGYAQVTYENLAPAQFSGRLGIGDSIENKKEIQAKKNKKESKIETIFKESSNLSLNEHLLQLKTLYEELPQKIKVLVKKGELSAYGKIQVYFESLKYRTPDEYI